MTSHHTPTQSDVQIRSARPSDAASVARLHVESFASTYEHLPETVRAAREQDDEWEAAWAERLGSEAGTKATLVAMTDGSLAGFVHFGPTPDTDDDPRRVGQILSIHVDPTSTGRGVGRALMAEAIRVLQKDGYGSASLWVVDTNSRAKVFYERLGLQHDGARTTQRLSIDGKSGDLVEIVRYRLPLPTEEIR